MGSRFFIFSIAVFLLAGQSAFSAGYEKVSLFGAKVTALGGIGSVASDSTEALAHNPALISLGTSGFSFSIHYSPTKSQLSGPWNNENTVVSSEPQTSVSGAGFISYRFNEKFGVALGRYAVGGGKSEFKSVRYEDFGESLDLYSDIRLSETALGAAYEVHPWISVGFALRKLLYEASYIRPARSALGLAIGAPEFKNMKDETDGYRLAVLFRHPRGTKLGLVYRSPMQIRAEGQIIGGTIISWPINLGLQIDPGEAQLRTTLPQSYTVGISQVWPRGFETFFEWSSINYSVNRTVEIESTSADVGNRSNVLNWKDQTTIKLGLQYLGAGFPIRVGFHQASQVTEADFSSPLNYPPGVMQTWSVGAGYPFKFKGGEYHLDFAYDFSKASGSGGTGQAGADSMNDFRAGNYSIDVSSFHVSFRSTFPN